MGIMLSMGILSGCESSKNTSEVLNIYNIGDYIDPDLIDKFTDETGIEVVYESYDTNEAMYQKIKSESSNFDIIFPSDYMVEKMAKENMLEEIDYNNIPNYVNINEDFKNASYDKDNKYSVPYLWGTIGIMYNKSMVNDNVDSWDILWNNKYEGNIMMLDSIKDSMGISLKRLGYSMNSTNEKEINEAKQELINQKPLVLAYANDESMDRLIGEDVAMGIAYSGDAVIMMEQNENLRYAIPKEGTNKWVDTMCIPKGAENKKEAETFINFLLEPENAKQNVDYIGYATPNKAAFEILDEDQKNNEVMYPSKELIEKSEVFKDMDENTLKLYNDAWVEIKTN